MLKQRIKKKEKVVEKLFMKRKEPKGWHPCVVLMVGGLAVIGAVMVTHHARGLIMKVKDKMTSILHANKCEECDC